MNAIPVQYVEAGLRLNRLTAGMGGIRRITGRLLPDNALDIKIEGVLLDAIKPRTKAPNYNRRLPTGRDCGLPTYEIAHLWGPGFGDEAWDGMMYAPRAVNQEWQNRGVEQWLRDLRDVAHRDGAVIELVARAVSHPLGTHRGCHLLREASYSFSLRRPNGGVQPLGRIEILVGPPPAARVEVEASLLRSI